MVPQEFPRFVCKTAREGAIAFYVNVPTYYRKQGCTIQMSRLVPTMSLRVAMTATVAALQH